PALRPRGRDTRPAAFRRCRQDNTARKARARSLVRVRGRSILGRMESVDLAVVREQARALGDPTRHAIFRRVAGALRPVTVAELTEHVGLHHTAVRQHLAKLVAARLVVEDVERRSTRGRPRLRYAVDPASAARWEAHGPYERLAVLLAEALGSDDSPLEVGRRAGLGRGLPEP